MNTRESMGKHTKENKLYHKNIMGAIEEEEEEEAQSSSCCFFCVMKEADTPLRRAALARFFRGMPSRDDPEHVLVMSGLWSIAMNQPDDLEIPSTGALRCMSLLISKALAEPSWLHRHQNIYIPYYAAHVLGSYTIRSAKLAELAVDAGAVLPLIELLRGRLTWVEQRVAARALGHLASYDSTFPPVARYGEEVVSLAMRAAATCLETVYTQFLAPAVGSGRRKYQCDLLTRGLGGVDMENRKAEEWASQLQCWSLYLLSCFACRDKSYHTIICREAGFLRELCNMWGGMANGDSPAGVGLMRILCRSESGREAMAKCPEVIESLCNLSRSSDDWQYMGIDCLLMLVKDRSTRAKVMKIAAPCLADLVELRTLGSRRKLGDVIARALLLDFNERDASGVRRGVKSLVERRKREEIMTEEESTERQAAAARRKKEGNELFWAGDVVGALVKYTEALELCPLSRRKERTMLYTNRAQCRLLLCEPDGAASDTTRALCLASPANRHAKSLWRRSQAYDMKGMAKESLMDCIMFVNTSINSKQNGRRDTKVPYYAARMINKQMSAAGLFASMAENKHGEREDDNKPRSISRTGLPTIEEEPWRRRR